MISWKLSIKVFTILKMIILKNDKEIAIMKDGGQRLRKVVSQLLPQVKVGMTTKEIDNIATKLIKAEGADLSFNKVKGYSWATCLPINEQVVHTPPSDRKLVDGDVLTIDIGLYFQGFHSDYATTIIVGQNKDPGILNFLNIGKKTLEKAISQAVVGNRLGNISKTIEEGIYGNGLFILKDLTGHGIGRDLHEDPFVFGYVSRAIGKTMLIKPGLTIAIEIIYSKGTEKIAYEDGNDWSIKTSDNSLSACFEHTIAVTNNGTWILT